VRAWPSTPAARRLSEEVPLGGGDGLAPLCRLAAVARHRLSSVSRDKLVLTASVVWRLMVVVLLLLMLVHRL